MKTALAARGVARQALLLPEVVELDESAAARLTARAVELAELGAFASESALDGPAGLFAALGKPDNTDQVAPFSGGPLEILSVYHKPAPACNYAQTACQVALMLAVEDRVRIPEIAGIGVRLTKKKRR